MTKVTRHIRALLLLPWLAGAAMMALAAPQTSPPAAPAPTTAAQLYQELGSAGLDPARVFHIRGASIEHRDLQVSFNDGTIAFTKDVLGRVTGAYFEGEGDLLLMPPTRAERASLGLFTGTAILEDQFTSAYLRFNDDTRQKLQPFMFPASDAQDFFAAHDAMARSLAESDALRLLLTFSRFLPLSGSAPSPAPYTGNDHFLHMRLSSPRRGLYDVFFDTLAHEQISVGQLSQTEQGSFYDLWTAFSVPAQGAAETKSAGDGEPDNQVDISRYRIRARVTLPHELAAKALLDVEVRRGGERTLLFELSRFLQVQSVKVDGRPVDFIHNPALEGTQLARRGNDVMAVVFPQPLRSGQKLRLLFDYSGSVLSEAGGGLLYVGARGTWYPNRGLAMSQFDLQFQYPVGWTLVATGKQVPPVAEAGAPQPNPGEQVGRWISEIPMPMAGFNLGQYVKASARAGKVTINTYASAGVENTFPRAPLPVPPPINPGISPAEQAPRPLAGGASQAPPSPARNARGVAEEAARVIEFLSPRLGPFPYSSLALTQMPGKNSQGWPGLIFLSSFAFLNPQQREVLHFSRQADVLYGELMPAHETAHQWWGDLVGWSSYRDQWIGEALANYSALMMLERQHPQDFELMMQTYRRQLLAKNKDGRELREAGPVTLGLRLSSSKFPDAYDAIAYGRGTWLFHMLRYMLRDASPPRPGGRGAAEAKDDLFLRDLRTLQQRFAGKMMTLHDVQQVFEENLPRSLWYEGQKSLDWFFDGWVNGTAIPRLQLADTRFRRQRNLIVASGTIKQEDAPADLVTCVPIYVVTRGRAPLLLGQVFADGPETHFRLRAPAGARKLLLDPYQTVLTRNR